MATTFVKLSPTLRLSLYTRTAVDQLRDVLDRLDKIKSVMDTQVDGADYSLVAQQFLDPTTQTSADGQALYNLVAGALAAVNVLAVQQLINRAG